MYVGTSVYVHMSCVCISLDIAHNKYSHSMIMDLPIVGLFGITGDAVSSPCSLVSNL